MENEERLGKLSSTMRKALEKIIARCEKAGIEYKWGMGFFEKYELMVYIQGGTGKRAINIYDAESAHELLDSDFDKYVFVEGYEAICCYEEGRVEAIVGSIGPSASKALILSRLTGRDYGEVVKRIKAKIDDRLELAEGGDKGVRVSIGNPGKTLLGLVGVFFSEEEILAVRVEGLKISRNKEAAEQLRRVTNSLFFELRRKRKVNLFVRRHYEVEISGWTTKSRAKKVRESEVGFPKFEYDKEPIELYWHAVSAYKMPLLQYLAYYQILEYYFMKYSMLGAKREIRNCLKDPEFNVDDDNDIERIVTWVSVQLGPRVSEKELLCNTIQGCMSKEALVSEVGSEPLKDYFKKEYRIVSQFRVSQENKEKEIWKQLAERIHDIRCRIVHTKEDDKRGRIMPFTKEEVLLRRFDLPIIGAVANKALIANSKKLSF